jgi:hypothetical protein
VPVAKLSERFYQKFGHDLVEELVNWLNEMDSGSRTDLRELNELNFARFDAKVEQRWVELRAEFQTELALLRAEMREGFAQLETRLTKRMFAFWVAQAATTAALVLGVVKLVR